MLHAYGGRALEREDCLVVLTPTNPLYYWGNFLLLPCAPRDDELEHWERRFQEEIVAVHAGSAHRCYGVNAPPAGEQLPAWQAAGFEIQFTAVLAQEPGGLRPPPRRARGTVEFRGFDLTLEIETLVAQHCADAQGFEPRAFETHRRQQMQRYAQMQRDGLARWFGVWCDGVLAADCGLMREHAGAGALGRFQHVGTHPHWRRRGLATALVHRVAAWGWEHWKLSRTLMCADPEDVAIGIYESLGFERIDDEWGLQRRAPQDLAAA